MKTLDKKKTAELLYCSEQQVERLARNGQIPAFKVGHTWIFPEDVLGEWIAQQARMNLAKTSKYPVL